MNKENKNITWHEKTYNSLINRGKLRGLDKSIIPYYVELHHILPRCLGGKNNPENLVLLTAREHIIAHLLLTRIYRGNFKILSAATKMFSIGKTKREEDIKRISTRTLAQLKEEYSKAQLAKEFSDNHKKNLSESHRGIRFSEKTKAKLKLSRYSNQVIDPNGKIYESIADCSKNTGIPQTTLKDWIKRRPEKGFMKLESKQRKTKSLKVLGPDGKIYNSIRECARLLGRSDKTIKGWIINHPELGYRLLD